ncbi:hypothetical protein CCP4SC76_2280013 [Gammaproteobacteria bacterium]
MPLERVYDLFWCEWIATLTAVSMPSGLVAFPRHIWSLKNGQNAFFRPGVFVRAYLRACGKSGFRRFQMGQQVHCRQ